MELGKKVSIMPKMIKEQITLMEKLDQYYERFNDAFPTMQLPYVTDREIIDKINECLDRNVPAGKLFKIRKDVLY